MKLKINATYIMDVETVFLLFESLHANVKVPSNFFGRYDVKIDSHFDPTAGFFTF